MFLIKCNIGTGTIGPVAYFKFNPLFTRTILQLFELQTVISSITLTKIDRKVFSFGTRLFLRIKQASFSGRLFSYFEFYRKRKDCKAVLID